MNMKVVVLAALAAIVLLNGALMGMYLLVRPPATSTSTAEHAALPVLATVPDFTLTSEKGTPFSPADLRGKVWVADFIFTSCPGPCPVMTKNMAGMAETLKAFSDVAFVSVSVDPERDTPEVLAKYGAKYGADPARWDFLTGDADTIQSIAAEGFLIGSVDDIMIHSTKFCLVDQEGRIRGYYTGTDEAEVDQLIADIHQLRKEL